MCEIFSEALGAISSLLQITRLNGNLAKLRKDELAGMWVASLLAFGRTAFTLRQPKITSFDFLPLNATRSIFKNTSRQQYVCLRSSPK
jgi:hypothetical protein